MATQMSTPDTGAVLEVSKRVLFICTGNYYRSRFAEAVFNYQAEKDAMGWRAFSRGLAIHMAPDSPLMSEHTSAALAARGIDLCHTGPIRVQLSEDDLLAADCIVALKEVEHRPMFIRQFPSWTERVIFWKVSDLDEAQASEALPAIERNVTELLAILKQIA